MGASGQPLMAGVAIGGLLGLAVALALALYLNKSNPFVSRNDQSRAPQSSAKPARPATPESRTSLDDPASTPSQPTGQAARSNDPAKRFDFYEILPGSQESGSARTATPQPAPREVFYLQAGAFPKSTDADNLKAKLALAGLEAQIQTATLANGKIWHRVRLGPYADAGTLQQKRDVLKQNNIEATVVKMKETGIQP